MARLQILLSAGLALVLVAACERPSAVAQKPAEPQAFADTRDNDRSEAPDRRREAPVALVDGKPMWSSSRRGTAQENAQRSFERNGEAFGARDVDAFVRKAHDFVDHPPAAVETLTRANGDKLLYDPDQNIFAVVSKDGAPRTMFKPDQGKAYWTQQKDRESKRQTARAERRTPDEG